MLLVTKGEILIKAMVVTCESALTNHTRENKNESVQNNWCLFDNHMYAVFGSVETE